MTTSPRLGFTYLEEGETAPETAVNEIAELLESASGHFVVEDRDLATPPGSPLAGQGYIVAGSPTGDWTGHTGDFAYRLNTSWIFVEITEGMTFWVKDENKFLVCTAASTFVEFSTTTSTSFAMDAAQTFNFSDTGEARFYADTAMTLTEQATSGTGTIAYEKSTTAAPATFAATTSPITLQAGAWLKVSASAVTTLVAVHLKRTA